MVSQLTIAGDFPVPARVFAPETFKLANGMDVVVVTNRRAPVVTHWAWYRVGSADSPPGKSGLAHFVEHLMFKGTAKIGPGEFSKIVARHGGEDNAMTSHDFTAYHQTIAKDRLPLVMEMEADRMINLQLTDEAVYPERDVIVEERRSRVDNEPSALLGEQLATAQYQHHPYRLPIIGWMHEIESYTRADAEAFYAHWYAPNNAILVVAGDIDATELQPLAEATYGQVPPREIGGRARVAEPPQRVERRLSLADARVRQPNVIRSYLAPSMRTTGSEHSDALEVMAEVLGGGPTSRLYRALVVDQGLAAGAGSYYHGSTLGETMFRMAASPRPGVTLEVLETALDAELERVLQDGAGEDEIARVKGRMMAEATFARDSLGAAARSFGVALSTGGSIDDVEGWPARLAAITKADVDAAAQVVLDRRRAVTGYLVAQAADHAALPTPADFGVRDMSPGMTGDLPGVVQAVAEPGARQSNKVREVVTERGIRAFLVADHALPFLSMALQFEAGSVYDSPELSGITAMLAGLLDEGAGDLDSQAFHQALEDNAIRLAFDGDRDQLNGSLRTLNTTRELAFELLRKALTAARFDAEPIERIRSQIRADLERRVTNPNYIASRTWFERAFGAHAYALPTNGRLETLPAIAAAELRARGVPRLARSNLSIGVAGDIEPGELAQLLDRTFGDLPETPELPDIARTDIAGHDLVVARMSVPQSVAVFGLDGISRGDPDYYPAYVANYILGGGGFSSRLMQEVREVRGLAYSVHSYLYDGRYAPLWLGGVATSNERVAQSIAIVKQELKRLAEGDVSDRDLQDAKTYLTGSFALRLTSNDQLARMLVGMMTHGLGKEHIELRNSYIEAVSLGDVRRAAARLFAQEPLVAVAGAPEGLAG